MPPGKVPHRTDCVDQTTALPKNVHHIPFSGHTAGKLIGEIRGLAIGR